MSEKFHKAVMVISKEHGLESCKITSGSMNGKFYAQIYADCADYGTNFRLLGD